MITRVEVMEDGYIKGLNGRMSLEGRRGLPEWIGLE